MLSSKAAAHEMQVTQDAFEYSCALSFMSHSDRYRYWALSWNKLGIRDTKKEAGVGEANFVAQQYCGSEIKP